MNTTVSKANGRQLTIEDQRIKRRNRNPEREAVEIQFHEEYLDSFSCMVDYYGGPTKVAKAVGRSQSHISQIINPHYEKAILRRDIYFALLYFCQEKIREQFHPTKKIEETAPTIPEGYLKLSENEIKVIRAMRGES